MKHELKDRLVRHLNFLEEELKDSEKFAKCSRGEYLKSRDTRRNIERWIENIINSTVDISRVILTIEGAAIPDTYRGIVAMISVVEDLSEVDVDKLATWVRFRNIVAHDYLDIKWNSINMFINDVDSLYKGFLSGVRHYLRKRLEPEQEK